MARSPAPVQDAVHRELAAQNDLLRAMLGQLTLCTETLAVIRADQLRLLAARGEAPAGAPDIHRCADPDHAHHHGTEPPSGTRAARGGRKNTAARAGTRKAGGRHGR